MELSCSGFRSPKNHPPVKYDKTWFGCPPPRGGAAVPPTLDKRDSVTTLVFSLNCFSRFQLSRILCLVCLKKLSRILSNILLVLCFIFVKNSPVLSPSGGVITRLLVHHLGVEKPQCIHHWEFSLPGVQYSPLLCTNIFSVKYFQKNLVIFWYSLYAGQLKNPVILYLHITVCRAAEESSNI
jgi:hypothetical protein